MNDDDGARLGVHIRTGNDADPDAEPRADSSPDPNPGLGARPTEASLESDVSVGLRRLCIACADDLRLMSATVVLMSEPGSQAVAASSGLEGERLEELQFGLGEGPGHEAFSHGRPVFEGDLRAAFGRWPGYAPAAVSAGVCGVFAFPLHQGAVRFGVLTMYSSVIRSLEDHELSQGLIFADVATGLLLDSSVFGAGDRAGAGLDAALRIRSEVYQAQGMVMVDLQVSLAEALARMRAHAYARGQDLDELAQGIVTGRLSMSQDEA